MLNRTQQILTVLVFLSSTQIYASLDPGIAAMGGAGVAAFQSVEASSSNPAILAYGRQYLVQMSYSDNVEKGEENTISHGVSLIDGVNTAILPAKVQYQTSERTDFQNDNEFKSTELAVSVGHLYLPNLSFGATAKLHQASSEKNHQASEYNSVELGSLLIMSQNLSMGFIYSKNARPENFFGASENTFDREYTFGTQYMLSQFFSMRLDVSRSHQSTSANTPRQNMVMAGFETIPFRFVPIRFGARRINELDKVWYTAGIAWAGPRLVLNYSFEAEDLKPANTQHSVDMRLHF
jgi:hypothetical protein